MKRAICLVVLVAMVLHCAGRLGFISYLYDNRYDIAFSLGLIADVPIAMCESEYFTKDAPLAVHLSGHPDERLPTLPSQAREIVLFAEELDQAALPWHSGAGITHNTLMVEARYPAPVLAIFHPPC